MPQDEPSEDSGNAESESNTSSTFVCPNCQESFSSKRSLARHMDFTCKSIPLPEILSEPRIVLPDPPPLTQLRVDPELDNLLATVDHDYVRWRIIVLLYNYYYELW